MNHEVFQIVKTEFQKWLDIKAISYARHEQKKNPESYGWVDFTDVGIVQVNKEEASKFWGAILHKLENTGFQPEEIAEIHDQVKTNSFNFTDEVGYKLLAFCWSRESSKTTEFENFKELQDIIKTKQLDFGAFNRSDLLNIMAAGEELYNYKTDPNRE